MLVLNATYEPINVCTVRRAVILVLKQRAEMVEEGLSSLRSERAADRKGQVGSGDRSERIRTYNFPQNRLTDHRINLTLYKLDQVVVGEALDEVIEPLINEDEAARLAESG